MLWILVTNSTTGRHGFYAIHHVHSLKINASIIESEQHVWSFHTGVLRAGCRSQLVQNCTLERWVHNRSCIAAGHLDVRDAVGIVRTKRGVAIRVLAAQYHSAPLSIAASR